RGVLTGSGVTTNNDLAIWSGTPGSLKMAVRKGDAAAGAALGVKYGLLGDPALNNVGQLAFKSSLTGSGVSTGNDQGIWVGSPGAITLAGRKGAAAAGTASGVTFTQFYDPVVNKNGE